MWNCCDVHCSINIDSAVSDSQVPSFPSLTFGLPIKMEGTELSNDDAEDFATAERTNDLCMLTVDATPSVCHKIIVKT